MAPARTDAKTPMMIPMSAATYESFFTRAILPIQSRW